MKNINRIFLFGDSWVEGQGTYERISDRGEFLEPNLDFEEIGKWRKENSWNKFIKEKTNCEVINFARQGSDNYSQFSHLNSLINDITENDLVLFGFTSKFRDSNRCIQYAFTSGRNMDNHFLGNANPLYSQISWDRVNLKTDKFLTFWPESHSYKNDFEEKLTTNFIEKFFTSVLDDSVYENIAQTNYLFYQEFITLKKLNVIFFDLFESYLTEPYLNPSYYVNDEIYITYNKSTMHEWLVEYEKNNYTKDSKFSIWENGVVLPPESDIFHPNQHGYDAYISYLFQNFINKKYNFN